MNTFWTNSVWYLILAVLSAILVFYVIYQSDRRKRDIGFLISVFGATLLIETVLYIFLRAYEYYPLLIPDSPKNDGVTGNIISQFSISSAILFVCVFDLSFKKFIFIALILYFIDVLFAALGIYEHYWYKSWMTLVGLVILFPLMKWWYKAEQKGLLQYVTIMLGVLALYLPTTNWIGILSGCFEIRDDLLIDPYISHAVVAIPKYLFLINMAYLLFRKRAAWLWVSVLSVSFLIDIVLYYTHLLYVRDRFLPVYWFLSFSTAYLYVYIMHKLIRADDKPKQHNIIKHGLLLHKSKK